jgi:tRNA threonylcarbamoyladenosine biosynthesis protein TsaB
MLILALDTSGKTASCALAKDGVLIAEKKQETNLSHSRTLLPLCEKMLIENGYKLSDVDLFAATSGPGSFTGLRIGIAAVKGFALMGDKPCAAVPTLLSAANGTEGNGVICAAVRARPDEFYCAFFERAGGRLVRLTEDKVMSTEEILKEAEDLEGRIRLCGEGSRELFEKAPEGTFDFTDIDQSAAGTALAAFFMPQLPCHDINPVYMKDSQAERMKKEREKK